MMTTTQKNILLICGGGSSEHDISLISAKYFESKLNLIDEVKTHYLCIEKDGRRTNHNGEDCELRKAGEIFNRSTQEVIPLDYAIPCIHGPPGENGQIQAVFEMMGLPFLGAGSEASILCFNKASTKIWLDHTGIANSPYQVFTNDNEASQKELSSFFSKHNGDIFLKAAHQGSSVGCYHVTNLQELSSKMTEAFKYGPVVLAEKTIKGRELEVAAFEFQNEVHISAPGEIKCPDGFYDYKEKYAEDSKTQTLVEAPGLTDQQILKIRSMAAEAFKILRLKDLARIDFFLDQEGTPLINEINTFPGHTPISMFPMMMENMGVKYQNFLKDRIFSH